MRKARGVIELKSKMRRSGDAALIVIVISYSCNEPMTKPKLLYTIADTRTLHATLQAAAHTF